MKFDELKLPSNKNFGFFITLVFFIVTGYFFFKSNTFIAYISAFFAIIFMLTTILRPQYLYQLNILWMRLGFLLGKIVSPIVLGIIFFGIFTPVAFIIRLVGRDELRLTFKRKKSHWIPRDNSKTSKNFKKQF